MKFDFNDILIEPKDITEINSRKEQVNTILGNGSLPLFAAPMDTVIDENNITEFTERGINVCLPRGLKTPGDEMIFESFSLSDIEGFIEGEINSDEFSDYVLIDIANGHMRKLYNLTKEFKSIYPEKILMVGNIANPKTYELLSLAGADYIRVGIGNGAGCWLAGAKIKTSKGYKNIENINTDDEVLTHTGEYKKVVLTHELNYSDDLIDINGNISTKDHKYYVIKKSDKDKINELNYTNYAMWVDAKDLTDDYLLLEME